MAPLSKERRRLLERATLQYAEHLDEAAEWLVGRGIDLEVARSSGLGVVRNPPPQHYHMEGRLSIPYLTDAGPVAIVGRCMLPHDCKEQVDHGKMAKPTGQGNLLYGVQSMSWADEWIVVTEGEIDALTWHQIGVPAISIPGAKNWKEHWPHVFADFSRVYVVTDGDDAGKEVWKKVSYEVDNAIWIKMPDGEDTNSMYLKRGKDYLLSRIKK